MTQPNLLYSPRDPLTSRDAADRVPEFRAASGKSGVAANIPPSR